MKDTTNEQYTKDGEASASRGDGSRKYRSQSKKSLFVMRDIGADSLFNV